MNEQRVSIPVWMLEDLMSVAEGMTLVAKGLVVGADNKKIMEVIRTSNNMAQFVLSRMKEVAA